jgi:hypothetical protein
MGVADILAAPARVLYAPVGETLPSENSVAFGGVWGGNWVSVGYTLEPVVLKYERSMETVRGQQSPAPLKRFITEEEATIETTLAEFTGDNLNLALDGTLTKTAAGASQVQKEEIESGGDYNLTERAWGFEGLYEDASGNQFPVRMFIYKGVATINGDLQFSREEATGIPLVINCNADVNKTAGKQLMKIQKVLAAHT